MVYRLTSRSKRCLRTQAVPALLASSFLSGHPGNAQQAGSPAPPTGRYLRDSEGVEVSVGAFAEVTASRNSGATIVGPIYTNSSQISQSATPAAGLLVGARQSFGSWLGYDVHVGYTRYTENYTSGASTNLNAFPYTQTAASFSRGSIKTSEVELTAAYLVHAPRRGRYAPFAEMGGGMQVFVPTPTTQPVSYVYRLTGLAAAGVSYKISPRLELRAEFRGLFFKSPDFRYGQGGTGNSPQVPVTSRYTLSQEPSLSLSYRLGGLKRGLQ